MARAQGMMEIRIHSHARARMEERGATEEEVNAAVETGEEISAKFGRTAFRRNFPLVSEWRGQSYAMKQVTAYAVREEGHWLVITVIVKYY